MKNNTVYDKYPSPSSACLLFYVYAAAKSIQLFVTPWTVAHQALLSMRFIILFLAVLDFPVVAASRGFLFRWLLLLQSTSVRDSVVAARKL